MKAIFIFGPPGSGKSSQAEELVKYFSNRGERFLNFDLGQEIEKILKDPGVADDAFLKQQKKLFAAGELVDIDWAMRLSLEKIKEAATSGAGLILAGEPRELSQAEILLPALEQIYGRDNLVFVWLMASKEKIKERLQRRKRPALDEEPVIERRLADYEKLTLPILNWLKERGYQVWEIDSDPPASVVFDDFVKKLGGN